MSKEIPFPEPERRCPQDEHAGTDYVPIRGPDFLNRVPSAPPVESCPPSFSSPRAGSGDIPKRDREDEGPVNPDALQEALRRDEELLESSDLPEPSDEEIVSFCERVFRLWHPEYDEAKLKREVRTALDYEDFGRLVAIRWQMYLLRRAQVRRRDPGLDEQKFFEDHFRRTEE